MFPETWYFSAGVVHFKDKQGYKATHCYFQTNNRYFPWELQIWDSLDERTNVMSHKKHEEEKEKH